MEENTLLTGTDTVESTNIPNIIDPHFWKSFNVGEYIPTIIESGIKLVVCVLVLYIGFKLIANFVDFLKRIFTKRQFDKTLTGFLTSIVSNILKILLILSMVTYLGIPTTSFVAILGAAGLSIGMALSGTLQNFAGGVMLLLFRPFKVEDFVEFAGYSGTVKEIQIFNTILHTPDNKTIIIPNSESSKSSIINYSANAMRRIDLVIGIGYDDDLKKAKSVLQDIVDTYEKIIDKKEATIALSNLGASSVDLAFRVWVKRDDYWDVRFELLEMIKERFDAEKISFPYPQRDIHVYNETA